MPGEAELIMFAIRSAIKLGQQSREAYVDATRRQALVLPLPNFPIAITVEDAGGYFLGAGARRVDGSPRLGVLVDKFKNRTPLTDPEKDEFLGLRRECFVQDLHRGRRAGDRGRRQRLPARGPENAAVRAPVEQGD